MHHNWYVTAERVAILEACLCAADHRDRVLNLIAVAADDGEALESLCIEFGLSEVSATVVLDMQLRRFTEIGRSRLREEYVQLLAEVAD